MSVPKVMIPNPHFYGDAAIRPTDVGALEAFGALAGAPAMIEVCLGRITPKARPVVPRLAAFLQTPPTAPPPASTSWGAKAGPSLLRMYLNDRYGDCVIASKYHTIGVWTGNDGPSCVTVADSEVSKVYFYFSPNDQGCVVTDVLDYWRDKGLPVNGTPHKIDGYVSVDWRNTLEVKTALVLFGTLTLAIDLPREWANNPSQWATPQNASPSVGGHDIVIYDYDADGVWISTWGSKRKMPWSILNTLNNDTELYAHLGADWYNDDQLAPNGVNVAALKLALQQLGGGQVPPIPDPTPPVPPTPPTPPVPPQPPVPPAPPVPPTPPAPGPNDDIKVLLHKIALDPTSPHFEFAVCQLLHASGYAGLGPVGRADPITLLFDALAVYAAYKSGDPQAIAAAVAKLVADLK